jgi:hypothetical protein
VQNTSPSRTIIAATTSIVFILLDKKAEIYESRPDKSMLQSQLKSHSTHKDHPEDTVPFPHRETYGKSRFDRKDQEPPSEKHPESPKSSPQYIRCAANGLCCGVSFFVLHS